MKQHWFLKKKEDKYFCIQLKKPARTKLNEMATD
jgi:hypothetical protein